MAPTTARWSTRLLSSEGRARGVATVRRDVTDAELKRLHEAGVRGVRFNFIKRLVDFTPMDELKEITERIIEHDWHIVVYFEAADLPELADFFSELPTTIVVDHMGRPDVTKPVDGPEFARFLKFMDDYENVWCKVTGAERLSVSGPPALNGETNAYRDVVPFARKVVEEFPDRVLWGTDWPHPNLKDHMPDDGLMVDIIPHIAPARRPAGPALGRQSDAALLARGEDKLNHGPRQSVHGDSRHDRLRRRAIAQGLLAQPVLHVADEGREPRPLQG